MTEVHLMVTVGDLCCERALSMASRNAGPTPMNVGALVCAYSDGIGDRVSLQVPGNKNESTFVFGRVKK